MDSGAKASTLLAAKQQPLLNLPVQVRVESKRALEQSLLQATPGWQ